MHRTMPLFIGTALAFAGVGNQLYNGFHMPKTHGSHAQLDIIYVVPSLSALTA